MAPRLEIRVLGDFAVHRDGVALKLPPSRKTRALLAYLAVTRRAQRRERLCEMFWDVPDDPRGSLRWSLSKLRPILVDGAGQLLEADRNAVALRWDEIDLDYDVLREVSLERLKASTVEQLEAIAGAFEGTFLADLQIPRCPEFEAWRVAHENETGLVRLRALRLLVDRLAEAPERALVHARALQVLHPEEHLRAEVARLTAQTRTSATVRGSEGEDASAAVDDAARRQTVRVCRSADGVRIAYAISGDGPVVVRSGHWMSHLEYDWESPVWGHWIDALSEETQLIRYDERLNGLSDSQAEDLSTDAMVADLEAVVEAAGVQRFVLLGVSQGCAVSVRYAVRHPERVAGMILYGGYLRGWRSRGDASELARREAMAVLMREGWGRDDPSFRQLFTSLFIPGASREQMDWHNELQKRTITAENAFRLSNAFADVDVSDYVDKVRVPTLILHGNADQVVPMSSGLQFAERIPNARFVELDSANHILLAGEPAFTRFVEETRAFVRESFARPVDVLAARSWRKATLLCAEFVSPVQSLAANDPEAGFEVVDPVVVDAADRVRRAGGTIIELSDSRLTAAFGTAGLMQDHASRACRVALELHDTVTRPADSLVRVRIAIDTGDVVISPARIALHEVEVRGAPLAVVHKLNAALRRDRIVATEPTRAAAGGAVRMAPAGSGVVGGFTRGQPLYEVLGASGDA